MRKEIRRCASILSFGLTATATMANAQSDDERPSPSASLQEIVVTAQKRTENIQDVPVAVTAFTADTLKAAQADNIAGLQGLVPGMTITQSGASPNTPQMSLRGISMQDVEKSTDPGISIVVDGIPLGVSTGALLDSFDVERIEVLRGPQGTLFGRNSTGGTISVIRTRPNPDGDISGKLRATVGSWGRREFEGLLLAPIIPEKLAVKFAGAIRKDNGQFKNSFFGGRNGDKDSSNFLVGVRATPTDALDLNFTYERMDDNSEIPPYVPIHVPYEIPLAAPGYFGGANIVCTSPNLGCRTPLDKQRNDVEIVDQPPAFFNLDAYTFQGSIDTGPLKFVAVTGYRKTSENQISDFDGTRYSLFSDRRPQKYHQFSQELRLESQFDGPLNFVGGAFYFKSKYDMKQRATIDLAAINPALAPGVTFLNSASSYDTKLSVESYALFLQAEYRFLERFKLILGGRQTWDKKTIDFRTYAGVVQSVEDNFLDGPVTGRINASAKFKKFTPKIVLQYEPSSNFQTYASYSKGYNTGGFNGRAPSVALVGPFKPEVMDAFEIGFKSEFFDRRVRLNVAAFHNTMKNKQEDVLVFVGAQQGTTTVNAAKARYQGVEVELQAVPLPGWTISSSAGYLKAKYLSYSGNLGQGFVDDLTGLKLRRVPKWTLGLISDYSVDVGPGTFGLNASLQYVSRYETNVLNDPRGSIPPTTRINMGARYKMPVRQGVDLQLDVFVKNLTNDTHYTGMSSGNSRGTFIDFANPFPSRSWGASATVSF